MGICGILIFKRTWILLSSTAFCMLWLLFFTIYKKSDLTGRKNTTAETRSLQTTAWALLLELIHLKNCDVGNISNLWKGHSLISFQNLYCSTHYSVFLISNHAPLSFFPDWCSLPRRLLPRQHQNGRRGLWFHDNWLQCCRLLPPPSCGLLYCLHCGFQLIINEQLFDFNIWIYEKLSL